MLRCEYWLIRLSLLPKASYIPRRLIPHIHFAYEAERGSWNSSSEEEQAFDFSLLRRLEY